MWGVHSLMILELATEECMPHTVNGTHREQSTSVYKSSRERNWFTDTEYKLDRSSIRRHA